MDSLESSEHSPLYLSQGCVSVSRCAIPLPFVDGAFDGVFLDLPAEFPANGTFVREAIRATRHGLDFLRFHLNLGRRCTAHC
jgi:hypothetical protein